MPIYDYECKECSIVEEALVRKDEARPCPRCGKLMVRLIGAPSFQLKGSGWYKTDFAGKNAPKSDE